MMMFLAGILGIVVLIQFTIIYNQSCRSAEQKAFYAREMKEMERTIRSLDRMVNELRSQVQPTEKIIEINAEKIGDPSQ